MTGAEHTSPSIAAIEHPVVLFDGVCVLCSKTVQFLIARDPGRKLRFASLQSDVGAELLANAGAENLAELKSIVFVEGSRVSVRSTAALRIARRLGSWLALLYAFMVVPRFIRDAVYDFIAARRYRWFGQREACMVPSPADRERFLD